MSTRPRRVVTGHTPDGVSVVVSDGPVPVSRELPDDGVAFHEIWNTTGAPASVDAREEVEPTERDLTVAPPPHGTKIRINEFQPGHLDGHGLQVLDDSEVTLRAGDVVVQRGTDHAWANRSDAVTKVAFILVDGAFAPDLLATLPDGAFDRVSRKGPRD